MESLFTGIKLMVTQPVVDAHPSNVSSNPAIVPGTTPFESDFRLICVTEELRSVRAPTTALPPCRSPARH